MDISKLYNRVAADRDHEARMCVAYCNAGSWDEAAARARRVFLLDEKLIAILEGRGADYGITQNADDATNVTQIRP
jgi:hypothetical protein